jgi:hypothetical protein
LYSPSPLVAHPWLSEVAIVQAYGAQRPLELDEAARIDLSRLATLDPFEQAFL